MTSIDDFNQKRQRLAQVPAEVLVDALMDLSITNEFVEHKINSLINTQAEKLKNFKTALSGIKRRRRFYDWREVGNFSNELTALLGTLKGYEGDAKQVISAILSFYIADEAILNMADDSGGDIGYIFKCDAKDVFLQYAANYPDKEWLLHEVFKISLNDAYGVRAVLVHCANFYLPENILQKLIALYWDEKGKGNNQNRNDLCLFSIQSIAKQLGDAVLYEKASLAKTPNLTVNNCFNIANIYYDAGEAEIALQWLLKIDKNERFMKDERNRILLNIYGALNKTDEQEQVAREIFREGRNVENLNALLNIVGNEAKTKIIKTELEIIGNNKEINYEDIYFLIDTNHVDEAVNYALKRADLVNGDFYPTILTLIKKFEAYDRCLVIYVLYKKLLESILKRAQSKYYHYGVKYLRAMEKLSKRIQDWEGVENHEKYFLTLRQNHGKKISFWSKYD